MPLPQAVYDASFAETKKQMLVLVQSFVPAFMLQTALDAITDDKIKELAYPDADAVIAAYLAATKGNAP
jgi:hypothetical protein